MRLRERYQGVSVRLKTWTTKLKPTGDCVGAVIQIPGHYGDSVSGGRVVREIYALSIEQAPIHTHRT
jgi:hypothetical protein